MRNILHVYTGDGKGKTTAAIGLTLRMLGNNGSVLFTQFLKKGDFNEITALKKFIGIRIIQFGTPGFIINNTPTDLDREKCQNGLKLLRTEMRAKYDLAVLDEINMACYFKLIEPNEILKIVNTDFGKEIVFVFTGRNAPEIFLERADLITEMKNIRHYFDYGRKAQQGIEY